MDSYFLGVMGLCIFNTFLVKHYKYLFEIVFWAKFWHFKEQNDSRVIHSDTTVCGTKMGPKIKGLEGVKAKRTKGTCIPAASRGGAAALQLSEHERAEERTAAAHRLVVGRREQDDTILELAREREVFGHLGLMCEPHRVGWDWDAAKLLYNLIQDGGEMGLNPPGHLVVFQSVVDAQNELAKASPDESKWTLWHVFLAFELHSLEDWGLRQRAMQELKCMIGEWQKDSYDVDCSPLFKFLYSASDDYAEIQTPISFDEWKMNDPVQVAIINRLYVENVSDSGDTKVARVWELRHDVKKALHALKTIAKL